MKLQGYEARVAVRLHQREKRWAVIQHEIKMVHQFLDRSHYTRWELMNRLSHIRTQIKFAKCFGDSRFRLRQLRWEWQLVYVQLRMCFKSPLPWEANRYCRWV